MYTKSIFSTISYKTFIECFCNPEGSESLQCLKDGSCVCKPNVGKGELNNDGLVEKCDYCLPNFYGFPNCKGTFHVIFTCLAFISSNIIHRLQL